MYVFSSAFDATVAADIAIRFPEYAFTIRMTEFAVDHAMTSEDIGSFLT